MRSIDDIMSDFLRYESIGLTLGELYILTNKSVAIRVRSAYSGNILIKDYKEPLHEKYKDIVIHGIGVNICASKDYDSPHFAYPYIFVSISEDDFNKAKNGVIEKKNSYGLVENVLFKDGK